LFQLGVATGFLLPPLLVRNHDELENIGQDLTVMFYGVAIFTTILFVFLFVCKWFEFSIVEETNLNPPWLVFKAEPPTPPSAAQASRSNDGDDESPREFVRTLGRLFKNWGYILLLLSYGINVGVFYALSTLLNQIVVAHFPVSAVNFLITYFFLTFH
jgi:MFS transporter, FLVCR family, feline leukemia virus subgroup C receptor-related protein